MTDLNTLNLYKVLKVTPKAKLQTIKASYKKLSKKHHPDVGGDLEKFKELSLAWAVLRNSERRKKYDSTGEINHKTINTDFVAVVEMIGRYLAVVIEKGISDKKDVDLINLIIGGVEKDLKSLQDTIKDRKQELTALKALDKRISRGDEERNIFSNIISHKIKGLESGMGKALEGESTYKRTIEELSNYTCITEVATVMRVWSYSQGTTTTTGFS